VTAGAATLDSRGLGDCRSKREGVGRGKEDGCTRKMEVQYRSQECSCTVYIRLYTLQLYNRVIYNWEILDRHSLLDQ